MQNAGYTIGTEASGAMQLELSSTSVTIEEGGNTEEVTATINASTKYMLVDGLYYSLTITDSTATLGTEGKSGLTASSVSLSDLTLNTTGSITASLNSSTGVITITSGSVTADENNDKVELMNNDNGINYGTINVAVKKVSISISPETASVEEGQKTTLLAQLNSWQKGTISWVITSGGTYATIPESSTGNSVEVTGVAKGTAKIKATYTSGNATATATRDVEVFSVIGDYVNYNVPYTDMNTNYGFTATDGWRLLSRTRNGTDSNKYDIKIISTGIPALLYYYYGKDPNDLYNANKYNDWWGTISQVNSMYGLNIDSWSESKSGYYAACGLIKNFNYITFNNGTSTYKGYWINVAGNTSGTGTDFISKDDNGNDYNNISVHNLTLAELNATRKMSETKTTDTATSDVDNGLFYLRNLENENSNFGYTSSTSWIYWLSTPKVKNERYLYYVSIGSNGSIDSGGEGNTYGLRPVVEIQGVTMTQDPTSKVWTIAQPTTTP